MIKKLEAGKNMRDLMKDHESLGVVPAKGATFSFSGYALYLVALGCVLDVLSTFFPWSEIGGQHWFLPFSFSLPLGWDAQFMPESLPLLGVSMATRVAAFLGLVGIVLFGRVKKSVFPYAVLIASVAFSFFSLWSFSRLDWPLYFGVYLALSGGLLKVVGIVLENLEVQVSAGEDEAAAGN